MSRVTGLGALLVMTMENVETVGLVERITWFALTQSSRGFVGLERTRLAGTLPVNLTCGVGSGIRVVKVARRATPRVHATAPHGPWNTLTPPPPHTHTHTPAFRS